MIIACLFFYLILLIYVDDILLIGNNPQQMFRLIKKLGTLISMKDMGHLNHVLGVEKYFGHQIHLNHAK